MTVFTQLFKNTQKVPALCLVKHDNDFLQTLPNPRYLPLKSCHRVFPPIQLAKRGRKTLAAFLGWLPSQRRHLCPSSSAGAPLSSLPLTERESWHHAAAQTCVCQHSIDPRSLTGAAAASMLPLVNLPLQINLRIVLKVIHENKKEETDIKIEGHFIVIANTKIKRLLIQYIRRSKTVLVKHYHAPASSSQVSAVPQACIFFVIQSGFTTQIFISRFQIMEIRTKCQLER